MSVLRGLSTFWPMCIDIFECRYATANLKSHVLKSIFKTPNICFQSARNRLFMFSIPFQLYIPRVCNGCSRRFYLSVREAASDIFDGNASDHFKMPIIHVRGARNVLFQLVSTLKLPLLRDCKDRSACPCSVYRHA